MSRSIRRLGSNDAPALRDLMRVFSAAFDDTMYDTPPGPEYHSSLLGDPSFIAMVAQEDKTVVGGLTAYVLRKPEQVRSEVYIYDLAVASAHRRRGIATELIDALKTIAREAGAWVMFVQADMDDTAAQALYRKMADEEITAHHFDIRP